MLTGVTSTSCWLKLAIGVAMCIAAAALLFCAYEAYVALSADQPDSQGAAGWVQGFGSIGAILVAVGLNAWQSREQRDHRAYLEVKEIAAQKQEILNMLEGMRTETATALKYFMRHIGPIIANLKDGQPFNYVYYSPDRPFPVFDASVRHFGRIPNGELRTQIIVAHGLANKLLLTLGRNNDLLSKFEEASTNKDLAADAGQRPASLLDSIYPRTYERLTLEYARLLADNARNIKAHYRDAESEARRLLAMLDAFIGDDAGMRAVDEV